MFYLQVCTQGPHTSTLCGFRADGRAEAHAHHSTRTSQYTKRTKRTHPYTHTHITVLVPCTHEYEG